MTNIIASLCFGKCIHVTQNQIHPLPSLQTEYSQVQKCLNVPHTRGSPMSAFLRVTKKSSWLYHLLGLSREPSILMPQKSSAMQQWNFHINPTFTWPSDAAATGCGEISEKIASIGIPSSCSIVLKATSLENGVIRSCNSESSSK